MLEIPSEKHGKTYFVDTDKLTPNASNLPSGETIGFVTYYVCKESDANKFYLIEFRSLTNYKYHRRYYVKGGTSYHWEDWKQI